MFIVVVARALPGGSQPLYGQFELDQAKALQAAGHQVVVAALDMRSLRRWRKWGSYFTEIEGLPAINISWPLGAVGPKRTSKALDKAWAKALNLIVEKYGRPDVVHAHFARFGKAIASAKNIGYRAILTEHTSSYGYGQLSPQELEVAKIAYQECDKLIAVSPSLAQTMKDIFGVEVQVISNIVDIDTFTSRPVPGKDIKDLVTVGNLVPVKRMDTLVRAFRLADLPDSKLTIIGAGPEYDRIRSLAGQDERITLTGYLDREQIAEHFANSGAFVFLSQHETFGVVLIEALAAGLPVFSSRCGGPEGFVIESVGELIDLDATDEQVAEALTNFVARLDDFDREQIRAYSVANFAPSVVASRLIRVYQEALLAD